jgi:DNA polymerase I
LFGPEKGNVFIKPDWSNIEMRVLAFASHDEVLQETFATGRKVHDENVKILFGLDKSDTRFDTFKRAAKTYIFGRGYGGGLRGIFERVAMQVPEANLTYEKMKAADDAYRQAHPKYVEWHDEIIQTVAETRTITNAFGRRRIFLGDENSIKREALNTPIQGTAADIANICLIQLHDWIESNKTTAKLVLQQHDAIMIECSKHEAKRIKDLMETIMQQQFTIWGYDVSFPVETAISDKSWQEMVSWEEYCESQRFNPNNGNVTQTSGDRDGSAGWNDEWGIDEGDDDDGANGSNSRGLW